MPTQDTSQIKNKIINFLRVNGPSLPVHIAKEIDLSILFTSAFLSELLAERQLKMSHMKIGSSKLHFLEGQEDKLESFAEQHLKSKERDAFLLLKENKFLKENELHPAIRVALKDIKDFAIPFNRNDEIIWRYYLIPESEFTLENEMEKTFEEIPDQEVFDEKPQTGEIKEDNLNIFDNKEEIKEVKIEKPKLKVSKKKSASQKKSDQFFNRVKEYLSQKIIEIIDIESFSKSDLSLRVRQEGKEELLVAFNKKKITENDIIKANKKAAELQLPYTVLSLGEPLKKMSLFINAVRNLSSIEKIE